MPAWLGELVFQILRAFFPWLSSGSSSTKVETVPGLQGLDRKSLTGTDGLTLKDLPGLSVLLCLLFLPGCFGSQTVVKYKLVEPGAVAESVGGKVKVRSPGSDDVGEVESAGMVLMPKSVYRGLRDNWIKNNPVVEVPDTKPVEKPK